MRHLLIAIALLGACKHERRNLASEAVHADSAASCVAFFNDVGEHHTYSALCQFGKQSGYCVLTDSMVGAVCGPPVQVQQPQAPAGAPTAPTPTPPSPPPPHP